MTAKPIRTLEMHCGMLPFLIIVKLPYTHLSRPSFTTYRFAGFDVMTLANNHLNDYGELPVNYTVNTLREVGIKAVGVSYGPYNSHQVCFSVES